MQAVTNLQEAVNSRQKSIAPDTRTKRNPDMKRRSLLLLLAALLHRLAFLEAMSPVYKEETKPRVKSDQQGENWKIKLSFSNFNTTACYTSFTSCAVIHSEGSVTTLFNLEQHW